MTENLGVFESLDEYDLSLVAKTLAEKAAEIKLDILRLESELKEATDGLKAVMQKIVAKYEQNTLSINVPTRGKTVIVSYIKPSTMKTFDSKAFKQEHPELAAKYTKTVEKPSSIRISVAKDTSDKELMETVENDEFI